MKQDARFRKILLIHTAFIGDLILSTPLVREIKANFPDSSLSLLLTPQTAPLFRKSRWVDEILLYDKRGKQKGADKFSRLAMDLRQCRFDAVFSPHRSLRSSLLAYLSGARIRIGFDSATGAFLYTHQVHYDNGQHEIDRNLSLLKSFNLPVDSNELEIAGDAADRQVIERLLADAAVDTNRDLIAIAPGSIWPTKRWPAVYYKTLIHMLQERNYQVVLIGGKNDVELASCLAKPADKTTINMVGKLSLTESAELLKLCRVLVTNDSAPMHLAAAVNTSVVAIFGPTVQSLGFAPRGRNTAIVEIELSCRPCGKHGGVICPIKTHACMTHIHPRQVLEKTIFLARSKTI
ncbi:MAG TPA: lipopolysaccharide heptosyltransferase II [bacterium]|jgi:heptosyltransferase-2|nr:lipopolysaccharide heptosyltransferase II [bacterium]HPG44506.1 lipopolysaccharide heptosyltransferase II [bacterium]HPM97064.1 lipopolysaccharide heptosyltransferase II [bacterium]